MQTFILLTRLVREEVQPSFAIVRAEKEVVAKVKAYLPAVTWVANYAVAGPWDYLDIFTAPDMAAAMKVSALVRHYGGAHTEVWPAVEWNSFEKTLNELAVAMEK